ncbi:ATP-binding protein [Geodermatophilus sp. URMC 62]|uniref:ATP-binding protein n=1 Tax=Geodermatophilus sp. URMC 62 TaxID=3423414 RepID=UPI00406C7577
MDTATRWPLVGREAELRAVKAALTARPQRSLVITGAAGVGRSRLAREALVAAAQQGHPTAWAVATGAAALVPLGALAHLLPAVDDGATGLALLQRATAAIAGDGTGPTPVLGVDDAHLLDQMSVTLLHQLAASSAVTLVLTVRTDAEQPDPSAPLWKDGLADRVQLEPCAAPNSSAWSTWCSTGTSTPGPVSGSGCSAAGTRCSSGSSWRTACAAVG